MNNNDHYLAANRKQNPYRYRPIIAWAFVLKRGGKPEYFKDASAAAKFREQNLFTIKKEHRFKTYERFNSFKKSFDAPPPYVASYTTYSSVCYCKDIEVFGFSSEEAYWEWREEVDTIMDELDSINNDHREPSEREALSHAWIAHVTEFTDHYSGWHFVPLDVKNAFDFIFFRSHDFLKKSPHGFNKNCRCCNFYPDEFTNDF